MTKTIVPPTLEFLNQLKQNNNKAWFEEHKSEYLAAKEDFTVFIGELLDQMAAFEPEFGLLRPKDCVFRIYRDVRFSKDKTPYKTHLAAGINKGGKRVHHPGYYLHIVPDGQSFFGGGIWHPEAKMLANIRQEIDYNSEEFLQILNNIEATGHFGAMEDNESLKRPPKGYQENNPVIKYLKMKNFILSRSLSKKEITSKKLLDSIVASYQELRPLNAFIARALD